MGTWLSQSPQTFNTGPETDIATFMKRLDAG